MINPIYIEEANLKAIKNQFEKTGIIQLNSFLDQKAYKQLISLAKKQKFKQVKIPDQYSYSLAKSPAQLNILFSNKEFSKLILTITNKTPKKLTIKKFSHKDYTLRNDHISKKHQTKIFITIPNAKWDFNFGGNLVFVKNDNSFVITPNENTLVIADTSGADEFVQYINHKAKNNYIILIEIVLSNTFKK